MHRVRILRTCLSEPQCHHDTASTDRSPAGDGAPEGWLPHACTTPTGVSVRRDRDLRGRRHVLQTCPIGIDTGALIKEFQSARERPCRGGRGAAPRAALENRRKLGAREPMGCACVFLRVWSEAAHGFYRCRAKCCQPGPRARGCPGQCHVPLPACPKLTGKAPRQSISAHASTACSVAIPPSRPVPHSRKPLSLCPGGLVSRCGFRRMWLACAARRRGNRKAIGKGTSIWLKPLPMRCGAGAMELLFPSSSTPPRAPMVSERMS